MTHHSILSRLAVALILSAASIIVGIESTQAQSTSFNLIEATVPDMQAAMNSGLISSEYLVQQYLKRINAYDDQGPKLNPILSLNPNALETARALDRERSQSGARGPLHGIPILLKDNIDTFDMPTTAGAWVLKNSIPPDDAFLTKRLRDAGAVILGKANLSEFANFVSLTMPNGFSAVGGQTLNPYGPRVFDPVGSSTGSAVGVATNLAAVSVGSETLGSIISPSGWNSSVGIRPTLGLISRDGIIPISFTQDTAGPITRTVTDAAIMLGAMAGVDANDPATAASAGRFPTDYTQFLKPNGLQGKRIGVVRHPVLDAPDFIASSKVPLVNDAIAAIQRLGATLVEDLDMSSSFFPLFDLWGPDIPGVLTYEFMPGINKYLASLGDNAPVKTLAEIIEFNKANPEAAIPYGQSILEIAQDIGDLTSPKYLEQLEAGKRLFGVEGYKALLDQHQLDALVFSDSWASFGAIPGYPSISVPAGYDDSGHPVPIEFLAGPYSEPTLIEIAYAYEQGTRMRRPPASAPTIAGDFLGPCDFNGDGLLGVSDVDLLLSTIRSGTNAAKYDVTGDTLVDVSDLKDFVTSSDKLNTYIGDANLDNQFDSGDLVRVFQGGQYEDGIVGNSTWATGDWNGNGEFDSSDLTFAMQEGGYVQRSRPAVNVVPEPSTLLMLGAGVLGVFSVWKWKPDSAIQSGNTKFPGGVSLIQKVCNGRSVFL